MTVESRRPTLEELIEQMRTIGMVAGQCSVEYPDNERASMAAAEAERCLRWADALSSALAEQARIEKALINISGDLFELLETRTLPHNWQGVVEEVAIQLAALRSSPESDERTTK